MTPAPFAALTAGAAVALVLDDSGRRLHRLLPGQSRTARDRLGLLPRISAALQTRPRFGAVLVGLVVLPVGGLVGSAVACLAAWLVGRAVARRHRDRVEARMRGSAARAVSAFSAELRAGRSPIQALAAVAAAAPAEIAAPLAAAAGAVRLGAEPSSALRQHATAVPMMDQLALCWRVSAATGAGLSDVAEALAVDLQSAQRRRSEVAVEVAASRATAALLAALPAVGIALGASLGAHPLHFLLRTGAGAAVLGAGLVFEVAGLFWTDRMIRSVERRT